MKLLSLATRIAQFFFQHFKRSLKHGFMRLRTYYSPQRKISEKAASHLHAGNLPWDVESESQIIVVGVVLLCLSLKI